MFFFSGLDSWYWLSSSSYLYWLSSASSRWYRPSTISTKGFTTSRRYSIWHEELSDIFPDKSWYLISFRFYFWPRQWLRQSDFWLRNFLVKDWAGGERRVSVLYEDTLHSLSLFVLTDFSVSCSHCSWRDVLLHCAVPTSHWVTQSVGNLSLAHISSSHSSQCITSQSLQDFPNCPTRPLRLCLCLSVSPLLYFSLCWSVDCHSDSPQSFTTHFSVRHQPSGRPPHQWLLSC